MNRLVYLVILFAALYSCGEAVQNEAKHEKIISKFREYVNKARKEWDAPGVAVGIVIDGKVVYINSGVQRVGGTKPITEDSIFCIMSCTKIVTVMLLHRLVDEGKISLDDKVTDYLPEFKLNNSTELVKVRHLISHCIGLPAFVGDTFTHLGFSQKEVLDAVAKIPLKHPVGTKYGYQNLFVGVAGMLIERVTGRPLRELMQEHIFDHLDMPHSSVGPHSDGIWSKIVQYVKQLFKKDKRHTNIVSGHQLVNGKVIVSTSQYQYVFNGTSGVNSTTSDYAKLLACIINKGVIAFGSQTGQRLVSESAWETMSSQQINIGHVRDDNIQFPVMRMDKKSFYYGNGMFGITYGENGRSIHVLSHMGAGTGWRSVWFAVPNHKVGIVVFCNYGSISTNLLPEALAYKFLDLYFKFSNHDWSADMLKKNLRVRKMFKNQYDCYVLSPPPNPKTLCGVYRNDLYGDLIVEQQSGGGLQLKFRNSSIPMVHVGGQVYKINAYDLTTNYGDDDFCSVYFTSGHDMNNLTVSLLRDSGPFRRERHIIK
jgi:CubicO group peptidase (beta-lactamase class C family)